MVLTKKKVIGLTLAGVLALSGTSVFAASEASSKDVQTPTLSATKAGKPGNGVKGELKARGEIPESVRKGLNGQKTGTANADKAGKDQVTLEEVEGVNVEDIKANAQEGKILKTSEIPDAAKKQSGGKTGVKAGKADKAGKDQVTLEEVEGVNVEDIKANAQEGKVLKTSEIPDAAKKQSSGKTTGVKK